MLVANFLIFYVIFLLSTSFIDAKFVKVDCKDNDLNTDCQCAYDDTQDFLILACKTILEASLNRLPPYSVSIIKVINSFDHWPTIPADYHNTFALILSENQIESIGDMTQLSNLQFLNLSHNQISKLDKSLSKMKELYLIDLSFNLLEEIHFEDFVIDCDKDTFDPNKDQIFSKLKILLLNGNRIKDIFNFDLVFVGMPLLNVLPMDSNMLTKIEVTGLSQQSLNVIKKAKQALETNATYMEFISAISQNGYYFGFNANSITNVHFNFQAILNQIFAPYKSTFLTRFLAISVVSESDKVICDCNIYTDLNFLIEQLGDAFANEKIPDGDMENFVCYKKDSDSAISLFTLINQNSVKRSDFCELSPETSTENKSSTASNESSKKSEGTSTTKTNTEKSTASLSKPSRFVKLNVAAFLIYRCLF